MAEELKVRGEVLLKKVADWIQEWPPQGSVCYGDVILLRHTNTRSFLRSHNLLYFHSGSSKQQQVLCVPNNAVRTVDDYWVVRPAHDVADSKVVGTAVKNGDIIRLSHVSTQRNLRAQDTVSPTSKQKELTCFGLNFQGDTDDNWKLEIENKENSYWKRGINVKLFHANKNYTLHSHPDKFAVTSTEIAQEVTGYTGRDSNDFWQANYFLPSPSGPC